MLQQNIFVLLPCIQNMEIELVSSLFPLLGIYGSLKFTRKPTTSSPSWDSSEICWADKDAVWHISKVALRYRNHCSSVSPSLVPLVPFNPDKGVSPVFISSSLASLSYVVMFFPVLGIITWLWNAAGHGWQHFLLSPLMTKNRCYMCSYLSLENLPIT